MALSLRRTLLLLLLAVVILAAATALSATARFTAGSGGEVGVVAVGGEEHGGVAPGLA